MKEPMVRAEEPCQDPKPSSICMDCESETYCQKPHGSGHDHSDRARECSRKALREYRGDLPL
jgi:hypothetical protein